MLYTCSGCYGVWSCEKVLCRWGSNLGVSADASHLNSSLKSPIYQSQLHTDSLAFVVLHSFYCFFVYIVELIGRVLSFRKPFALHKACNTLIVCWFIICYHSSKWLFFKRCWGMILPPSAFRSEAILFHSIIKLYTLNHFSSLLFVILVGFLCRDFH